MITVDRIEMANEKVILQDETSIPLAKYFAKAVFLPGVLIIAGYVIFGIADAMFGEEYKSEWLTKNGVMVIGIGMVTLNALFMGVLATPILLNFYPKVSTNILFSFLTWFLCPLVWIVYLWVGHYQYLIRYSNQWVEESGFIISNTLPYLIGLVWTFIRFRQRRYVV